MTSDAVDGHEPRRDWQLGTGMWLLWSKPESEGTGIDRVASVPGGYWLVTEDGALLEYWGALHEFETETVEAADGTSKVVVTQIGAEIRPARWEMHTGPGTGSARKMTIVDTWRKPSGGPAGWFVN